MSFYELATLDTVISGASAAAPGVEAWVGQGGGRLCGAWVTDIGSLNRIYVLRIFDSAGDLLTERERALRSSDPFGCGAQLTGLSMDSYRGVGFHPGLSAGVPEGLRGPLYEIRTYYPRVGNLTPLLTAWQAAVPVRIRYSPMAVAMYALDGGPRYTQIWPYASHAARSEIRSRVLGEGTWPPEGGPACLQSHMTSDIGLPLGFSPLQ